MIRELALRVEVTENANYTAAYPKEQICDITVVCEDGTRFSGRCTMTKGEPGNPVREAELGHKFFELRVPIWGEPLARRVYGTFSSLESVRDMRAVADDLLV